jgi:hypothetical protein
MSKRQEDLAEERVRESEEDERRIQRELSDLENDLAALPPDAPDEPKAELGRKIMAKQAERVNAHETTLRYMRSRSY